MSAASTDEILTRLEEFAQTNPRRPAGVVDWMHYAYLLRYGGHWDALPFEAEWRELVPALGELDEASRSRLVVLAEQFAWTLGRIASVEMLDTVWGHLTQLGRGRLLAGLARHFQAVELRPDEILGDIFSDPPDPPAFGVAAWVAARLAEASFDEVTVAEIGINAIRTRRDDLLESMLARKDLPSGPVPRVSGCPIQRGAERQLLRLSARLPDVLLEGAVRFCHPTAVRLILELGANPNIPCWTLERSYSEPLSALSYAITARHHVPAREEKAGEVVELLLRGGVDPQGLDCEGKNYPLMCALESKEWDLADVLLKLGALFEGGLAYDRSEFETSDRSVIPAGHPLLNHSRADLEWVKREIEPLVPLAENWELPLFYSGGAQGGFVRTFLHALLEESSVPLIAKYEAAGLSTRLTPVLIIDMTRFRGDAALDYLLRDNPNLPEILARIRQRRLERQK
jgi:hypothetical protein